MLDIGLTRCEERWENGKKQGKSMKEIKKLLVVFNVDGVLRRFQQNSNFKLFVGQETLTPTEERRQQ